MSFSPRAGPSWASALQMSAARLRTGVVYDCAQVTGACSAQVYLISARLSDVTATDKERTWPAAYWFQGCRRERLVQADGMVAVLLIADVAFLHRATTERTARPACAEHIGDIGAGIGDLRA